MTPTRQRCKFCPCWDDHCSDGPDDCPEKNTIRVGDWVKDGLQRGRVTGEGFLTNRDLPTWVVDLGGGKKGYMLKDQAEPIEFAGVEPPEDA